MRESGHGYTLPPDMTSMTRRDLIRWYCMMEIDERERARLCMTSMAHRNFISRYCMMETDER